MAMLCPICRQEYERSVQCPRCQVALVSPILLHGERTEDFVPPHWTRDPWARTVLGVLLAQGLFFALRKLFTAGVLASAGESEAVLTGPAGLIVAQILQLIGLCVGSVLAGAGQRGGGLYGSMVGVWNGILCMVIQGLQGEAVTPVLLYSQPLIHAAVGAFGGVLGSWIWKPMYVGGLASLRRSPLPSVSASFFALTHARIHWFRILIGCVIAVLGHLWADALLHFVLKTAEGHMTLRASVQHTILTLEISALAVFIGGAFAGATTWHGSAQGAWVGLITSAAFVGYQLGYRHMMPSETLLLSVGGILGLALLGGSFGGRLLPPLAPPPPPSRVKMLTV